MILCKKQIQVYSIAPGVHTCHTQPLTDWLDEKEGMESYRRLKSEKENGWFQVNFRTRYVQVVV